MADISSTARLTDEKQYFVAESGPYIQESPAYTTIPSQQALSLPPYGTRSFYSVPPPFLPQPSRYLFPVPRYYRPILRSVAPSRRNFREASPLSSSPTADVMEEPLVQDTEPSIPVEESNLESQMESPGLKCGALGLVFLLFSLILVVIFLMLGISGALMVHEPAEEHGDGNLFLLLRTLPKQSNMDRIDNRTQFTKDVFTTCTSDTCRWEGQYLDRNLNYSVDPCSDFYSHVCSSNWYQDNSTAAAYVSQAAGAVLRGLWEYLSRNSANASSTSFLNQAAYVARGCVEGRQKDKKWARLLTIFSDLGIPKWPYHSDVPDVDPHDVAKVADKMLGTSTFVTLMLRQRTWDKELQLHVDSPPIFLRRFEALGPVAGLRTYRDFVYKVLWLRKKVPRNARGLASDIVRLEEMMSEAAAPSARSVPVVHISRPLGEFKILRNWNWLRYFSHFVEGAPSIDLRDIVILDRNYIDQLAVILAEANRRTLINYIGYRVLIYMSPLLPARKAEFVLSVSHPVLVTNGVSARLVSCMFMLERLYPFGVRVLTWEAINKTFSSNLDSLADDFKMVQDDARSEMKTAALSATWLKKNESRMAVAKIERMRIEILPMKEERTLPPASFSHIPPRQGSLLMTYYNLVRFMRTKYWTSGDPTYFQEPMTQTGSVFQPGFSYDPQRNVLTLSPATVIFAANISNRLQATSIPFLLTPLVRGMFSTLDPRGSIVGADGAVRKLLSPPSQSMFLSLSSCIQGTFIKSGRKYIKNALEESLFLYENVADIAVLHPLYNIFLRLVHKDDALSLVPLPSPVNMMKAFFINYASTFCEPVRSEVYVKKQLRYKTSVPGKLRVNGPLKKFRTFGKVFDCVLGARMNSKRSCPFW
ncbi:neprilysin-2-like [Ornithodoros turicata]|uniref:neprilysin-2-like n=1 Tax=Ornithodoros turicata TaxID=34597 RepID=UPI003139F807